MGPTTQFQKGSNAVDMLLHSTSTASMHGRYSMHETPARLWPSKSVPVVRNLFEIDKPDMSRYKQLMAGVRACHYFVP
jgi:hypothetical protein